MAGAPEEPYRMLNPDINSGVGAKGANGGILRRFMHVFGDSNQSGIKDCHIDSGDGHDYGSPGHDDSEENHHARTGIVLICGIFESGCLILGTRAAILGLCSVNASVGMIVLGWMLYELAGFTWFYGVSWLWTFGAEEHDQCQQNQRQVPSPPAHQS
jgi:hypothetical protein